jgi:TP901 family phage tail tape measure protein
MTEIARQTVIVEWDADYTTFEKAMKDGEVRFQTSTKNINQNLKDVSKEAKKTGEDTSKAMKKAGDEIENAGKKSSGFKDALKDVGKLALGFLGAETITQAVSGIARYFVDATQKAKEFEQGLSELSAITGVTGSDLEFYAQAAEEVGRTTTVSAAQAVEAFKLIGSAKPDLLANKEALVAVTQEAITLAQASGLELPQAANSLALALNQFQLPAEEAARIINTLAAGSKAGAAEIPETSEALKNFGVAAAAAGVSVEESVGAIQLLAEFGIKGAEAGTALRNVLSRLSAVDALPKEALDQLKKFGVDLNIVRDATLPVSQRLQELGKISKDASALVKVFGLENQVAGQIVLGNVGKFRQLTDAVTGTNVATEQAAVTQDNFAARTGKLANILEGLSIKIGQFIINLVEPFVIAFNGISDLLGGFNKEVEKTVTEQEKLAKAIKSVQEPLRQEQAEMNLLFRQLNNTNISSQERSRIIGEINSQYGEYLPKLLTEKDSINSIAEAQERANLAFEQKILFVAFEEEIQATLEKTTKIQREVGNLTREQLKLEAQVGEQGRRTFQVTENGRNLEGDAARERRDYVQESIRLKEEELKTTSNANTEIEAAYAKLAEKLGTTLEALRASFGKKLPQLTPVTEEEKKKQETILGNLRKQYAEYIRQLESLEPNTDAFKAVGAAAREVQGRIRDLEADIENITKPKKVEVETIARGPLAALQRQLAALREQFKQAAVSGDFDLGKQIQESIQRVEAQVETELILAGDPDAVARQVKRFEETLKSEDLNIKADVTVTPTITVKEPEDLTPEELLGKLKGAATDALSSLGEIARGQVDIYNEAVNLQQDRITRFTELAKTGSTEQLSIEEERLAKLTELQEQAAARQRRIAEAQLLINQAVTISESVKAIAQAFGSSGPLGIITGIAMSAALGLTLAATASQVSSIFGGLPKFRDGSEFIPGPGTGTSDSILARVSKGERIVPYRENMEIARIGGIPNKKLPEAVAAWHSGPVIIDTIRMGNEAMLGEMQEVRRELTLSRLESQKTRVSILATRKGLAAMVSEQSYVDKFARR